MPIKAHKASEFLQTPEDIAAYLNATIEEMDELTNQKKAFNGCCDRIDGYTPLEHYDCIAIIRVAKSGRHGHDKHHDPQPR